MLKIPLCVSQSVAMTLYSQVTQISVIAFHYTADRIHNSTFCYTVYLSQNMKNQKKATTDSDLHLILICNFCQCKTRLCVGQLYTVFGVWSSKECVIETLHRDVATSSDKRSQLHLLVSVRGSESTGAYKKVYQIPVIILMMRNWC